MFLCKKALPNFAPDWVSCKAKYLSWRVGGYGPDWRPHVCCQEQVWSKCVQLSFFNISVQLGNEWRLFWELSWILPGTCMTESASTHLLFGTLGQRLDKRFLLQGYSKSGLVGFADIAVGEEKILAIHFLFEGNPFSVAIGDRVYPQSTSSSFFG